MASGPIASAELSYLIKRVHFLGREVPIIVQNKNGPCPLLAIANVLLLRNTFQLHKDAGEITETRLMSLVAERLLDANLDPANKDEAYLRNQQQNISDAIALLPRLATGIDVNVRFRTVTDFEFTSECAIFDLLDISLVHGWLVDPQDETASKAIGSSSYNNLVEKLVDLQCSGVDLDLTRIDSLRPRSNRRSEEGAVHQKGKQDLQVQAAELASSLSAIALGSQQKGVVSDRDAQSEKAEGGRKGRGADEEATALSAAIQLSLGSESKEAENPLPKAESGEDGFVRVSHSDAERGEAAAGEQEKHSEILESGEIVKGEDLTAGPEKEESSASPAGSQEVANEQSPSLLQDAAASTSTSQEASESTLPVDQKLGEESRESEENKAEENKAGIAGQGEAGTSAAVPGEAEASSPADSKGKEKEGPEQDEQKKKVREGRAIQSFLEGTANQLTYHGLVRLHEGIKERELCVFFRNNHFNTLFRYNGELYILATDQGYLHQPGLVWERLSSVDGDTTFVTGTFQLYRPPDDYQAPSEGARTPNSGVQSDLQFALALQQEESDLLAAQEAQLAEAAERRRQQDAMQRPPDPQPSSRKSKQSGTSGGAGKPSKKKDDKCSVM